MEYLDYTKITRADIGEYGAYVIDDKLTLVLAQQAYLEGGFDGTESYFTALAYDLLDEDEEYRIEWFLRQDYMDDYLEAHGDEDEGERIGYDDFLFGTLNDDGDLCDWDNPSYISRC